MNTVTVIGNLAADPELRYTPAGQAVCTVRVAVNRRRKDDAGQWQDTLEGFFTAVIWHEHGENVTESLRKGDRVLVTGRLSSRSYEDKEGHTRWVTEIQAEEICPSLRWARAKVMKTSHRDPIEARSDRSQMPPDPDDVPF